MTTHFVNLLDDLTRKSLRMASLVEDIVEESCDAVIDNDRSLAKRVIERDNEVDDEEVEVETEVIRLMALYQPVGSDLRLLCTILKVNNDLERIADCAVNIAERACHVDAHSVSEIKNDIEKMGPVARNMLRKAVQAYGARDADIARLVRTQDDSVDAMYGQIVRDLVDDASDAPEKMADFLDLLSIAKNLERIADHATNIAEDVIYLCTGKIVRHRVPSPPE
jgi:phosphate transport system protein